MKRFLSTYRGRYFVFVFVPLLLSSCDWFQPKPPKPKPPKAAPALPPETQSGKNTIGCLVNGEIWVPEVPLNFGMTKFTRSYADGNLTIGGYWYERASNGQDSIRQGLSLNITKCISDGIYSLKDGPDYGKYGNSLIGCIYQTSQADTGWVEITRFDLPNRVIAGRFAFTLTQNVCDTIRITEGRFDAGL